MKRQDVLDVAYYEEEIENLKFECSQLHHYTDHLQEKLTNVEHILREGLTFHRLLVKQNPTSSNKKQLNFLEDLLSVIKAPMFLQQEKEESKPKLKSIYDLK